MQGMAAEDSSPSLADGKTLSETAGSEAGIGRTSFAPLFEPGLHRLSEEALFERFVKPFSQQARRIELVASLELFLNFVRDIGIRCEVWLNGSFTTTKPEPDDIDLVVHIQSGQIDALPETRLRKLNDLNDRGLLRARYSCDVYVDRMGDAERKQYWLEKFGRGRDGSASKGIPVLRIGYD